MKRQPTLAIALQTWEGDCRTALAVVQLICQIEKSTRSDIEFIISARRGTNAAVTSAMVQEAKQKFERVLLIEGKRYGVGWPCGCNDLWAETMMRTSQFKKAGQIASTGVLTFEPDCVPLRPDWLLALAEAWMKAETDGYEVMGTHAGDPTDHINGNGVFACNILRNHMEMNSCETRCGWDSYHGKLLLSIGVDTPLIVQRYQAETITREELEAIRKEDAIPAMLHGVKGTAAISAVQAMINDGTFFAR